MSEAEKLRNANYLEMVDLLTGRREAVLRALRELDQATTRELAQHMGRDVLSVRPRISELVDLDLVEFVARKGKDGVYRARTCREIEAAYRRRDAARKPEQLSMPGIMEEV